MAALDLPVDEIVRRYVEDGESIHTLKKIYTCSHDTIANRLKNAGVTMRNRGGQPKAANIHESRKQIEVERLRAQRDEQIAGLWTRERRMCPRCRTTFECLGSTFVRHVEGCTALTAGPVRT